MNLKPLGALVPGRIMLLVAALLGLGVGWYLYKANVTGDYLVQRNFNHLNQIGQNINTSLEALRAQVNFNLNYQGCLKAVRVVPTNSREVMAECVEGFKSRLIGLSPLVDRYGAISSTLRRVKMAGKVRAGKDGICELGEYLQEQPGDSIWLQRDLIRSRFLVAHSSPGFDTQYRSGEKQEFNYESVEGACPDDVLLNFLEIDLYFNLVHGLQTPEGYFDSIVIARSIPRSTSGGSAGQPVPEILYNSAMTSRGVPEEDIRQLFQTRHSFERFNSIFEIEYEQAAWRERSSGFAELAEKKGDKKEVKVRPLAQSSVVPIDIGGFGHVAFVQPLQIDNLHDDRGDLVIIGIVSKSAFNTLKYALPFNYLSLLLLILVVGLLSFNFIRLSLIRKKGVLFRRDTYLSYGSMMGVAALVTVFLANLAATMQLEALFDRDKEYIAERALARFDQELAEKLRLLKLVNISEEMLRTNPDSFAGAHPLCRPAELVDPAALGLVNLTAPRKVRCGTTDMPAASSLFQLNENGRQIGNYYAFNTNTPDPGFVLSRRNYYRQIVNRTAWQYAARGGRFTDLYGQRFYMERIESLADTAKETAVSIPATGAAAVTAVVTKFKSIEDVVLPPGFGFAVFENHSGKVLYHSDTRRSLRENFYRATGDDEALKGVVVSRAEANLDLNYKGESISALVTPMPHVPWTLTTYYREPLVDIVNFHFSMTASILSGTYIFGFILISALVSYLKNLVERPGLTAEIRRRRIELIPFWINPISGAEQAYVSLTLLLSGVLILYVGVIYYLDLRLSLIWLLGVPALIFWLWHWLVCPEYHRKLGQKNRVLAAAMPFFAGLLCAAYLLLVSTHGGLLYVALSAAVLALLYRYYYRRFRVLVARAVEDGNRRTVVARSVTHYRLATTLFVLLLSVLPTLLLHNENFDVHEKLWVEFANWSNVDRLKARSRAYRQYADRMYRSPEVHSAESGESALNDYLVKNWEGVYLPRNEIHVVDTFTDGDACENNLGGQLSSLLTQESWPRLEPPWLGNEAMMPELMTHMLVVKNARLNLASCHPHVELHRATTIGQPYEPEILLRLSFLKSLVKSLPILSSTGSLLEGFSEQDNLLHDHETGSSLRRRGTPNLIVLDAHDPLTGLYYLTSTAFPHTRSAASHLIFIPYFLYVGVAGVLVFLLTGFLLSRQTGIRFAAKQPLLDRPLGSQDFFDGLALLVPATMTLQQGYRIARHHLPAGLHCLPGPLDENLEALPGENLFVLRDLRRVLDNRTLAAEVLNVLERARDRERESADRFRLIVIADIDPFYWLTHRHLGQDMDDVEYYRWDALLRPVPVRAIARSQDALSPSRYRDVWQASSPDERMLLAGLHHEGILNYRNRASSISLYRRGLVKFRDLRFCFDDPGWEDFVAHQVSEEDFKRVASRYENELWVAVRGPLLVALVVAVFFIAYVAQDEMRVIFSLLGTVGGVVATVGVLSDRLRDFRSYLGG